MRLDLGWGGGIKKIKIYLIKFGDNIKFEGRVNLENRQNLQKKGGKFYLSCRLKAKFSLVFCLKFEKIPIGV